MAEHMTAEQLRELINNVALYARTKLDEVEDIKAACFALTAVANSLDQLAARLSGMAAVPAIEGRIYVVNKLGMATLCRDEDDARHVAARTDAGWPQMGPHVVARLSVVPAWQPIETAPKDGTEILVIEPHGQAVAHWDESEGGEWDHGLQRLVGGGQWVDGTVGDWGCQEYRWLQPTHWMPLPAAPEPPYG